MGFENGKNLNYLRACSSAIMFSRDKKNLVAFRTELFLVKEVGEESMRTEILARVSELIIFKF